MRIASVADVKTKFGAYLKESENGPVIITRNGRPVAALLALQDEDKIERLLMARSPRLRAILDAANRRIEAGLGIEHEQFWRELDVEYGETSEPERTRPKKRVAH